MGRLVFVVGKSGTGKSTSLRNLNPKETIVINSDANDLPFKGFNKEYNKENKNYAVISDTKVVTSVLKDANDRTDIKRVVIDTWSRMMTDAVMTSSFRKNQGYDKWADFAGAQYDLLNFIRNDLREDLNVYLLAHPESYYNESGLLAEKIAVQGKQLERMGPESFSSIVLYAEAMSVPGKELQYLFRTKTKGTDTCKTPIGMFDDDFINNDLALVDDAIMNYYE